MNNHNLKPFNTIDPNRHAEISRIGGIASGKARREKREQEKQKKYWKEERERLLNERAEQIFREMSV